MGFLCVFVVSWTYFILGCKCTGDFVDFVGAFSHLPGIFCDYE